MFPILVTVVATAVGEYVTTLQRKEVAYEHEPLLVAGLLVTLGGWIVSFVALFFTPNLIIDPASLGLFALYALVALLAEAIGLRAMRDTERSLLALVSSLTIVGLLIVDAVFGYDLKNIQIIGVFCVVLGILVLGVRKEIPKQGIFWALLFALLSVGSNTLFKRLLLANSVPVVQVAIQTIFVLTFLVIIVARLSRSTLRKMFREPFAFRRMFLHGSMTLALGYASAFGSPSLIIAARRATSVVAALVSGHAIFHETHVRLRIASAAIVIFGIVLLADPMQW